MPLPNPPLWPALLLSPSLNPTTDTTAVDTDTVDTDIVDTEDMATTEARGPLMLNPRLKLMPLPNPMLMLTLGAMDIMAIPTDTDTTAIPTVISAKDLLMPNLRLRLRLMLGDTVMVDTTVMAVLTDTDMDTVTSARGPLMPNPRLRPNPGDTTAVDTDTDTADTDMVDTVDTIMVELLK